MKWIFYLLIAALYLLFLSCSSAQTSSLSKNDYMPLAIGNKWYYNLHTTEIIGIDTIEGKKYFKLKYENVNTKFPPYYHHQRMSNDTLFTLRYEEKYMEYFERITAIFTLDSGEVALIELPKTDLILKYKSEGLPTGRRYSIKAINKDEDTIELFTNVGMIDGDFTETYKKGIGRIKSISGWGIVTKLIDYELNN